MDTEIFEHKNSKYTIEVSHTNVGGVFGSKCWKLLAKDDHDKPRVELMLSESLAAYIQTLCEKSPEEFLRGFAKSEIKKIDTRHKAVNA